MRKGIFALFVVLVVWKAALLAQGNTAELYGVIKDPSGNVISGATIKLQTLETGLLRTITTRRDGTFTFLGLRPGRYSVRVEAEGFRPKIAKEILLTVGQSAESSFQLEISPILEAVEVLSSTQLLEARRTSVATTIVERLIDNLPSNGRDYINFTLLDSAASRANQSSLPPIPVTGLNIDGQRARANMVSIDGVDAIDNTINGVKATICQDAVQEFEIIKSGYSAEFGRSAAAVINIVSKQGGKQFQGEVFGILRSRYFSATNAFAGEPDPGDTNTQAGLTLGGPLKQGRTFFLTSFETTQNNSIGFSSIGRGHYGLQEMANPFGSGSLLVTSEQAQFIRSAPASLTVPYSIVVNAASRTALYGNTPAGPTTFSLTGYPLPASFRGLTTEAGNYKTRNVSYINSTRLDHNLSDRHSLFMRVGVNASDAFGLTSNSQTQIDAHNAFSRTNNLFVRDLSVTSQLSSLVSPAWLNELRFQFSRRGLGLTTNSSDVGIEIPGIASIGAEPFAPAEREEKRWQINNSISHIRAKHTYKAGIDFNYIPAKTAFPLNQSGLYTFPVTLPVDFPVISSILGPQLTSALRSAGVPSFSSVQLYGMGLPDSFVQQFGGFDRTTARYRNTTFGSFFQDSWKLSSNLLLQYGVRYDVEFLSKNDAPSPLFQQAQDALGVDQSIPTDTNNIAPRLGFSWDPFKKGKTILRGSFGLYYGHPLTALSFLADVVDGIQSPFLASSQLTGVEDLFQARPITPIGSLLVNPLLGFRADEQRYDTFSPVFLDINSALSRSPVLPTVLPIARDFRYTYSKQATFGIERELASDWSVSADYTYMHALHIERPRNINQGNFSLISTYERSNVVCPSLPDVAIHGCASLIYQGAGGPLAGLWDALGANSPTSLAPLGQLLFNQFRPSGPNYALSNAISGGRLSKGVLDHLINTFGLPHASGSIFVPFFNVKQYESSASSIYHALTVKLNKRFSRYYQVLGSWTWAHSIDDATDIQTSEEPQDNRNTRLDRGNSNFDQRHRFVLTAVFDTPRTASTADLSKILLGNWTFAPRIEIGSGRPYRLLTQNDRTLVNNSSTARPSIVALGTPGSFVSPDGKVGLAIPELGFPGNLGRNVYRTSGFQTVDFRLTRHVQLTQAFELNLSVDVFNLFNHFNVYKVDTAFTNAGRPVSAFNPRQIQFGVRILF
ncbi:MAG: carboxypeptidase regulatory-like domain-containing protein [Acidobacteriota bacterium]